MPKIDPHPKALASLAPPPDVRTVYTFTGVTGLELDCTAEGLRIWRVRYQVGHGASRRERKLRLGSATPRDADYLTFGQAKDRVAETIAKARAGDDQFLVGRGHRAGGDTFGSLFMDWLEKYAKRQISSWNRSEGVYNSHLKNHIGDTPCAALTTSYLMEVRDEIADDSTPGQADRAMLTVSTVMTWGVKERRIAMNIARGIPKIGTNTASTRVASQDELRILWKAVAGDLEDLPITQVMADALRFVILTGQRRKEVAGAAWSEVHGDLWEIAAGRMKNRRMHVVPLAPLAFGIVKARQRLSNDLKGAVFRGRTSEGLEDHAVSRALARTLPKIGLSDLTPHDLRRTMATTMARLRVPGDIIARCLSHTIGGVTAVHYNHFDYVDQKREAFAAWEAEVMRIVNAKVTDDEAANQV